MSVKGSGRQTLSKARKNVANNMRTDKRHLTIPRVLYLPLIEIFK
jgi:hypothetical protein